MVGVQFWTYHPLYFSCNVMHTQNTQRVTFQGYFEQNLWNALRDLIPFAHFKKREKHTWKSVTFSIKSNTPPLVFFTFLKLYKWYQNRTTHHKLLQCYCCFVDSKPRLIPLNQWLTIPHLQLQAAITAVRVTEVIISGNTSSGTKCIFRGKLSIVCIAHLVNKALALRKSWK